MVQQDTMVQILKDLELIHRERIESYYQVIKHYSHLQLDLKGFLTSMAHESYVFQKELTEKIGQLDGMGILQPGRVYHLWKDMKAAFNGTQREDVLDFCEKEEAALVKAYQSALQSAHIDDITNEMIYLQEQNLEKELEHIQKYRAA